MSIDPANAATPTVTVTAPAPSAIKAFDEDGGPSFSDVLDIINPLQHIPIINTIYQHLTGDTEGAVADVAGGTLWAGPIGLVGSLIDLAVKSDTGKSISDNILGWLGLEDDDQGTEAAGASAKQQQAQQQQEQQIAAVTTAPPAVAVQALSPLPARQRADDRKESDRKDDKDGAAAKIGDYMVFGAAGSGQPMALTPAQPAAAPAPTAGGPQRRGEYLVFGGAQPQQDAPASARAAAPAALSGLVAPSAAVVASAVSQTVSAPIGRQGDYMVFGGQPMTPVSASVTAASPLPPISTAKTDAVANSVPASGGPAQLSPLPSGRTFAAPARRTQVTPNALPMPTTGPAALPGHGPSQAIPTAASSDDSWFVQAVNSGLDKYAAAQRLTTGQDNLAASAAAGAQATTLH